MSPMFPVPHVPHIFTAKRYLFINDPQDNIVSLFKDMHIEVRNI